MAQGLEAAGLTDIHFHDLRQLGNLCRPGLSHGLTCKASYP